MRKELNYGSSFPAWRFYHEHRVSVMIRPAFRLSQASTGWMCQVLNTPKPNTWGGTPPTPPQKKVIAMVANVAAFGLRGSS